MTRDHDIVGYIDGPGGNIFCVACSEAASHTDNTTLVQWVDDGWIIAVIRAASRIHRLSCWNCSQPLPA